MMQEIFRALNIKHTLIINSLGCSDCMNPYKKDLVTQLKSLEGLCQDCIRRIDTNPVRVFDCKEKSCNEILHKMPRLTDNLCDSCDNDFATLQSLLDSFGIAYTIDKNLVRGLDYYNKTAFEFVSDEIGAQSSIAGGGRYDKLVEFLDGKPTPAVGFAIGIERIMDLVTLPQTQRSGWYFGAMSEEALPHILKLARKKRADTYAAVEYRTKSLKGHLKAADKTDVRYCAVIGEDELAKDSIWVKDLKTKEERVVQLQSL